MPSSPSSVAARAPLPLAPDELASGLLLGGRDGRGPVRRAPHVDGGPREVLESLVLETARSGPLYVSFSGGRDSSAVLAVATLVTRRAGLPAPTALTLDIVGSAAAAEQEWQELVLDHLRVEQVKVPVTGELGLLGPVARRQLLEVGLVFPPNAHLHAPLAQAAAGGSLLTGVGGDELFQDSTGGPAALVLAGQRRPTARDLGVILTGIVAPRALRRRGARRGHLPIPWIKSEAQQAVRDRWWSDEPPEHTGYRTETLSLLRSRYAQGLRCAGAVLGARHGCRLLHPFLEPSFVAATARRGGRSGFGGRDQAMRALFSDVLPEPLLLRSTKASFPDAVWPPSTLELLRSPALLDAVAQDPELRGLVDLDALAATWTSDEPHYQSGLLAQAAWLAVQQTGSGERQQP